MARVMVEAEHQADVQRFSQSVADALRVEIGVSNRRRRDRIVPMMGMRYG